MKDKNIRYLDMGRRVSNLLETQGASFPDGSRASELIAIVNSAVLTMETQGAKQDAAELARKQATAQKKAAKAVLLDRMRPINRTARGMDKVFPGAAAQFAMPRGSGDQPVIDRAQVYLTAGPPMGAEFVKRGLPSNFLTELAAALTPMTNAIEAQNNALAEQTAATAAIEAAQAELIAAVRELSPIVMNTFAGNAALLAAWKSASRVERAPKKKAPPQPTT